MSRDCGRRYLGIRKLVSAIFQQAIRDLDSNVGTHSQDAYRWLKSPTAKGYMGLLLLDDPAHLVDAIIKKHEEKLKFAETKAKKRNKKLMRMKVKTLSERKSTNLNIGFIQMPLFEESETFTNLNQNL